MYVSVDWQKLGFLHKHQNYRVVADLDFISNRTQHCDMFPIESARPFEDYTLTELQGLFRNTTGKEPPTGDKETLEELLRQLVAFLPDTECNPDEVAKQASYLEDKFPNGVAGFCYVRGANTPTQCEEVFNKLTTEHDPVQLLQGARQSVARKQAARQSYYNREGVVGVPAPAGSAPAARNVRNAGQPGPRPRSGVCGLIHDALDARYKETGEVPTREWIKALATEKGWNPSTAGVQYGAWRKALA